MKNRSDLHPAELQLIEKLIHQRSEARRMGKWDKADRLRNELAEQGIDLEDVGENTTSRMAYPISCPSGCKKFQYQLLCYNVMQG